MMSAFRKVVTIWNIKLIHRCYL